MLDRMPAQYQGFAEGRIPISFCCLFKGMEKPNFDLLSFVSYSENEDNVEAEETEKNLWTEEKTVSEIDKFIDDQVPKSTKKKTESDFRKFAAFLEKKEESRPVNTIPAKELNIKLSEFIITLHKDDGEPFDISTYSGIRYSIERFLKQVNHPEADLNGPAYAKFRAALAAKLTSQSSRERKSRQPSYSTNGRRRGQAVGEWCYGPRLTKRPFNCTVVEMHYRLWPSRCSGTSADAVGRHQRS